jgi:hypothetical protein
VAQSANRPPPRGDLGTGKPSTGHHVGCRNEPADGGEG